MKLIYLTDIHDALKELRALLDKTQADLYLLSGDILYKAFYEEEKIFNFVCLQEEFYQICRQSQLSMYPMDLALDILRFPEKYKKSKDLQEKAQNYRELFDIASKTMKEKYSLIKDLINKYADAPAWVLPGNYDIDLQYTDLREHNLHCQVKYKRALKFAGYGGAPVQTSGIPEKLAVVYHEKKENGIIYSEGLDFFSEHKPDILVLHNPVYGFFDCIPSLGHVGSHGIRSYLDEHSPILVLSGHVHEDYGIAKRKNTIYLNPSNFGGVDSSHGWEAGGTYAEIEIHSGQIENINFMLWEEDKAYLLYKIQNTEQGLHLEQESKKTSNLEKELILRA